MLDRPFLKDMFLASVDRPKGKSSLCVDLTHANSAGYRTNLPAKGKVSCESFLRIFHFRCGNSCVIARYIFLVFKRGCWAAYPLDLRTSSILLLRRRKTRNFTRRSCDLLLIVYSKYSKIDLSSEYMAEL